MKNYYRPVIRPCARCGVDATTKFCKTCRPLAYKDWHRKYEKARYQTPEGRARANRKRPWSGLGEDEILDKLSIARAENEGMPPKRAARGKTGPRIDPSCSCDGCEYYRFLKALMCESGRAPVIVR